jgi:hypothetical protein
LVSKLLMHGTPISVPDLQTLAVLILRSYNQHLVAMLANVLRMQAAAFVSAAFADARADLAQPDANPFSAPTVSMEEVMRASLAAVNAGAARAVSSGLAVFPDASQMAADACTGAWCEHFAHVVASGLRGLPATERMTSVVRILLDRWANEWLDTCWGRLCGAGTWAGRSVRAALANLAAAVPRAELRPSMV